MNRIGIVRYLAMAAMVAAPVSAQSVISAKAGVVHYIEGEVFLVDGEKKTQVQNPNNGRFTEMKDGDSLVTTAQGRAEVLLNPGVFLRLGEDSAIRMISTRLSDTRVEVTTGTALVETAEVLKDNAVTILAGNAEFSFTKMGLVRIDPVTGARVYKGQVTVAIDGNSQVLKDGREILFEGGNTVAKFDADEGDPLFRWANRRAEYIAMANVASANMVRNNGSMLSQSGWYYNPYYGMMTFLPIGSGLYRSPFGYMFYTPSRVHRYYQSYIPPVFGSNPGFGGGGGSSTYSSDHGYHVNSGRSASRAPAYTGGLSGGPSGSPAASAPAAAPAARGASGGTGRGGGSAGRGN